MPGNRTYAVMFVYTYKFTPCLPDFILTKALRRVDCSQDHHAYVEEFRGVLFPKVKQAKLLVFSHHPLRGKCQACHDVKKFDNFPIW